VEVTRLATLKKGTRRHNQDGCVYKLPDGTYRGYVRRPDGTRKWFRGKRREDVLRQIRAAKRLMEQGMAPDENRQLLKDYLEEWLETVVKPTWEPSTYVSHANKLRCQIVPMLGDIRLGQLSPAHIQAALAELVKHYAASTVNTTRGILGAALEDAVRQRRMAYNPVPLTKSPRPPKRPWRALSEEEALRFVTNVRGDRLEGLYLLAIAYGLRRGEILALRWRDVDFAGGLLHITGGMARGEKGLERRSTKTHKEKRLPLLEPIAEALRRRQQAQVAELLLAPKAVDSGYVFTSATTGKVLSPDTLRLRWREVAGRTGILPMRFHDLRHSTATLLLSWGVPLKIVQEILGHASIKTTGDVYAHLLPGVMAGSLGPMTRLLGGDPEGKGSQKGGQ
jgi:integrase